MLTGHVLSYQAKWLPIASLFTTTNERALESLTPSGLVTFWIPVNKDLRRIYGAFIGFEA